MNEVFVLRYTYGSTDEEEDENWKQLGAYSSLREAELAIQRFVVNLHSNGSNRFAPNGTT